MKSMMADAGSSHSSTNLHQLRSLLAALEVSVDPLKSLHWNGQTEHQVFGLVQRAAIVRQWEGLHALLTLADNGHGAFAVPALRSAYEELIWIEYLFQVRSEAGRILRLMAAGDAAKSVVQQWDYLEQVVAQRLGWTKRSVELHAANGKAIEAELKKTGKRLGWNKSPPTFRWLSKAVGREKEYTFLYHATSSFVHFSPHELMRRIWGSQGQATIGSDNFTEFWQEFAAYWAARTFISLLVKCEVWETEQGNGSEVLAIVEQFCPVPIITTEELWDWPTHFSAEGVVQTQG